MKTSKRLPKHYRWTSFMTKTMLAAIVVSIVTISSCSKEEIKPSDSSVPGKGIQPLIDLTTDVPYGTDLITVSGTLVENGMTTFQYGTHMLLVPGTLMKYALKSDKCNLSMYVNKTVEVSGFPVEGYPLDLGPIYIDVISVKVPIASPEIVIASGYVTAIPTDAIAYQYGWKYKLSNPENEINYPLVSSVVNLGRYLDKFVTVKGEVSLYYYPELSIAYNPESTTNGRIYGLMGMNVTSLSVHIEDN